MNKNSNNIALNIIAKTWNKETDDLYDFEAKEITTFDFKMNNKSISNYIFSSSDKIHIKDLTDTKKKILESNTTKIMGEIVCHKDGHFVINNPMCSQKLQCIDKNHLDRLWLVLQKNDLRSVEEGDILKLGRVRLKIDKICIKSYSPFETNYQNLNYLKTNATQIANPGNSTNNNLPNVLNNSFTDNCEEKKEPKYICRICFRSESDLSDPLISPCKCSGSMGYIHYKCLKQCINIKITKKQGDNYICYIWKNFECEICLIEYPKYIKYKSSIYPLVDLNITYDQYIILDYTLYDDNKKKSFRKGIIVFKVTDDEEITIGRTQTNTIKLKDISVSRMHCYFIKKNNKIYVSDKGSKFGTLLYLNKSFTLSVDINKTQDKLYIDNNVSLVSGRNLFNIRIVNNWSLLSNIFGSSLCCKCKSTNDDEVILNIDEANYDENEFTKIKEVNNYFHDSYCDYFINLETIIKNDTNCNNNNSFI